MTSKDFVTLADWSADALRAMLERAGELKQWHREGRPHATRPGCSLAMYFEKPSLRTRVTFEAGIAQLGGNAITLPRDQVGLGTRESPEDVARNLSRWVHALVVRCFDHALIEQLAGAASIPVINGLTDALHPCQAMADLLTISERRPLGDAQVVFVGDGNNVAASLAVGSAILGGRFRLASPASHRIDDALWRSVLALAEASGATIEWQEDPEVAVRGADFLYTDVWASMGQESEAAERRTLFAPYQLNSALVAHAPSAWILHCLPAHRGEEITAEILDGPQSLVFEQAENRLHAQKAILERLLVDQRHSS